uniref:Rab-GAP TBC domain-containing protein n=1 Tax=Trypanosoma congolense (strain IL3000) TaxID=1068625 RepID=G0UTS1_TRYCI|nr:conserved hypothetical protein [Trypanosoma congolense IL3000]
MAKAYGSKNPSSNTPLHLSAPPPLAFSDGRAVHRGTVRGLPTPTSGGLSSSLHIPLRLQGADKRPLAMQEANNMTEQLLRTLHRELRGTNARYEVTPAKGKGEGGNSGNGSARASKGPGCNVDDSVAIIHLSGEDMRCALSMIIQKQNLDLESRRQRLKQFCEDTINGMVDGQSEKSSALLQPCCMVLHDLLEEPRQRWMHTLSARVRGLKKELPVRESSHTSDGSNGSVTRNSAVDNSSDGVESEDEMEWSVEHLYETLVSGLNSTYTEKLIVSDILGGDTASLNDGIDAFGLLTVFRAPVQAMLTQHQEALAPSLSTLRQYFAALHPSAGCPRAVGLSDRAAACNAYVQLNDFLNAGGGTPRSVAASLRKGVSPSLRRLLYARALQLQLTVSENVSLMSFSGDLQSCHYGDAVAKCITFGVSRNLESIKRRLQHRYSPKNMDMTAKVLQAIVKVDNMQNVGDSDRYFTFSDETEVLATSLIADKDVAEVHLKSILLQMARPPDQIESYLVCLSQESASTESPRQRSQQSGSKKQYALPSGFFPVEKCTLLIAPVCYVTGEILEMYSLASAFFGQLWCRLQGPTPELAQCCWIFESLAVRFAAPACLHATRVLRYPPLRLALRWMMTGFADILEPTELLSLWDILLSYHVEEVFSGHTALGTSLQEFARMHGSQRVLPAPCALWLLPIMAASIFVYRAPLVERCASSEEMLILFTTGHHLRCRPLLQHLLFMAK